MTLPRPPARPLPFILAAVIGAAALLPPETDGLALAGIAGLVALAAVAAAPAGTLPRGAWLLALLLGAAALAARFAQAPGPAVLPWATALVAIAAGTAAAAAGAVGPRARAVIARALAGAGAFVGARAVYEAVWGLQALALRVREHAASLPDADAVLGRLEQGRAYAGFPTPAAAAGFLALAIPVTVAAGRTGTGRTRAILYGAAALQAAGLLATRSLTGASALLVAVLLAAVLSRSRRVAIAGAAIVLAIGALAALRSAQVLSRSTDDSPWALRWGNARVGVAIAADHPWIGVGLGGYAEAFARYRTTGDNEARHAHDLPVELAAELGVPAGLAASALVLWFFLGPLVGAGAAASPELRGAAIGAAAFAVHNLADFTAFLPSVLLPAVILRSSLGGPPARVAPRTARFAFAGAALVAGAAVALSGLADARVDRAIEAARHGMSTEAAETARRAVRLAPWSADAALVAAEAEAALGRLPQARAAADRAVALAPVRGSVREARARMREASGDAPGAYADLEAAVALNPLRTGYVELRDRARAKLP